MVASLCFCLLAILSTGVVRPVASRAVSVSDPRTCHVCINGAPNYASHTTMHWSQGGRICAKKTFSRQDDWFAERCGEGGREEEKAVELTDVPTCEVCHENSTLVEAWHKTWTKEDGSQCASVEFVNKT